MTPAPADGHKIVVVDGSNIATEGRSMPSLSQLNEAVLSFREERPDAAITVVVDATFGHRIDKSERPEFDEAVAHNELVAPPAGAIGRGDAFVLGIANKVGATILSNDSFQEFHGDYPWLFDAGRLVGGKPVPNIGWVFVDRLPVKGPVSRKSRSTAKGKSTAAAPVRQASRMASQPMPVPKGPPPGPAKAKAAAPPAQPAAAGEASGRRRHTEAAPVNDLLPFLEFVERHPAGSSVTGVVESYSSHGAYVTIGDVRGYVPLRLMGDPPPRSARDVMKLGEAVTLVVVGFAPARRNVDLSLPGAPAEAASVDEPVVAAAEPAPARASRARKRTAAATTADEVSVPEVVAEAPEATKASKATNASKATKKASKASKASKAPAASPAVEPGAAVDTATTATAAEESGATKRAAKATKSAAAATKSTAQATATKSTARATASKPVKASKSASKASKSVAKATATKTAAPATKTAAPATKTASRSVAKASRSEALQAPVDAASAPAQPERKRAAKKVVANEAAANETSERAPAAPRRRARKAAT